MKKIIFIFITLYSTIAHADTKVDEKDIKYTWSYGALADTMKPMRNNCEITSKDEFIEMGNWFRMKNAYFSMNELIQQCVNQRHKFSDIDREYVDDDGNKKKCEMPLPCNETTCSEENFTENIGCNIFLTQFIKNNNLRAKILNNKIPGTYVKKVPLESGRVVYQIVDVILADNYWQNNRINNSVNNDEANTKIYDITTGDIIDTGLHTWTNDMFFDVSAARSQRGDVRGAFINSYIQQDIDLTSDIYAMYDKRRGQLDSTLMNTYDSRQEGDFDVKYIYAEQYRIYPQTETESESNGVMFNGKVAHLDWLGHFLYGMNREESIGPDLLANAAAHGLSIIDGLTTEPLHMQNAWDMGSELVRKNKTKEITTFKNIQTHTPQEAYEKAAQEMKKIYIDAQNISCTGNCNPRPNTDDIVICTDSSNRRLEFVFDDICNKTNIPSTIGNTYSDPGVYFGPGMK